VFEERVAARLGLPVVEAAAAMYRLANSLIHDLLHRTTVQRGLDPRRFSLFSFGGTAGMHVTAYARELGVERVVVPHSASVHGAYGLVTSDVAHEDQITSPLRPPVDTEAVRAIFAELESRVRGQLEREGFTGDATRLARSIDMRYRRQVHLLTTPVDDGPLDAELIERAIARFERLYEERYGAESAFREAGIELVGFRLRGTGRVPKPALAGEPEGGADAAHAIVKRVLAWVDAHGAVAEVPGYAFDRLAPGNRLAGPAIVWTPITTVVVGDGETAHVDGLRNLVVTLG
jgi:N-methylhydantoinase A